jgi:hypothetical protein
MHRLVTWLNAAGTDIHQLERWCQGLDIPLGRFADEPYLAIVGGLPIGADEAAARAKLAEAAASLVLTCAEQPPSGQYRDKYFYNLFELCGELNYPDRLAEPLSKLLAEGSTLGEYDGIPLSDILLHAVAYNQIDNRHELTWRNILESPQRIPRYLAFSGCVMMPADVTRRGEPYWEVIGFALKWMAIDLDQDRDRSTAFRGLIAEVRMTYLDPPLFDRSIRDQANQHDWPAWAVDCLPSLWEEDGERAVVWGPVASSVPDIFHLEVKEELCGGRVLEVEVNGAADYLRLVAPVVERYRRKEARSTVGSMRGAVSEALLEVQNHNSIMAPLVKLGRRKLLHEEGVLLAS